MKREFQRLERGPFDLLVIGGGIYGAWMAYDAVLRGLKVALVEKSDWAAGTSSASSKLIHGGLRYLEQFRLGLVRTSLHERRRLARLAPHRVYSLRFIVPVYAGDRLGRIRLKVGLSLYDLLAGRDQPVAGHRSLSRQRLLRDYRFLDPQGLRGGFDYGDAATDDARYAVEIVDGAWQAGAAAVNGAEAVELLVDGGRVRGAAVRDCENARTLEVPATVTISSTGPWTAGVLPARCGAETLTRMTKGVHLTLPALPSKEAFLLTARSDGRVFFLIPWYGRTLLGTTDTAYHGHPDSLRVEADDIRYLLTEANRVLDGSPWSESDILGSFVGLRTLQNKPDSSPSTITREWTLEEPMPGLLLPVGGKLTSARADSAQAADRVMQLLDREPGPSPTEDRPFPWSPDEPFPAWLERTTARGESLGVDPQTAECLAYRFGSRAGAVHDKIDSRPGLAARIDPELPFCRAEVVHAAEAEMACTLEDILRRRIPLVLLARPDERCLGDAADLAGDVLGWSPERRTREVASLVDKLGLPSARVS